MSSSSSYHFFCREIGQTIRTVRSFSSSMMCPASIVLPKPTSSATRSLRLPELRNFKSGLNWYALKVVFDDFSVEMLLWLVFCILKLVLLCRKSSNVLKIFLCSFLKGSDRFTSSIRLDSRIISSYPFTATE